MTDHPDEARLWADHRKAFSRSVAELLRETRFAFEKLNEIRFSAPWRVKTTETEACE